MIKEKLKEILEKIRQELLSDGINVYLTLEYKEDDFGTNTERFSEDFKLNLNQYCFVYIARIHVYKDFFDNPEKYKEFIKKISNCYGL